jgi:hypothetical protein
MVLLVIIAAGFAGPAEVRWPAALIVAVLGGYTIVINWIVVIEYYRKGKRSSRVPLVGAVLVAVSLLVAPDDRLHAWAWTPFIADPGSGWMLAQLALHLIARR